jgi:hypothetical protein
MSSSEEDSEETSSEACSDEACSSGSSQDHSDSDNVPVKDEKITRCACLCLYYGSTEPNLQTQCQENQRSTVLRMHCAGILGSWMEARGMIGTGQMR